MRKSIILGIIILLLVGSGCLDGLGEVISAKAIEKTKSDLYQKEVQLNQTLIQLEKKEVQIKELSKLNDANVVFLTDYAIALSNIHLAINDLTSARTNYEYAGWAYLNIEDFYYYDAEVYYDLGKEQTLNAKELLLKANKKLAEIQEETLDPFFKKDIINRMEQVDIYLLIAEDWYWIIEYNKQETYQYEYGTDAKATELYNKYLEYYDSLDSDLRKLSIIQNKIDLEWDQDWYPTYQNELTIESETLYL